LQKPTRKRQKGAKEKMEIYKAEPTPKNLNGYQITADGYKEYLEKNPNTPEEVKASMQKKIKVLSFLGECDKEEKHQLFNSSAFNDMLKGYVLKAADNLKYTREKRQELINEIAYLLDTMDANESEQYYLNN